jgi:hypothetical protein
MFHLQRQLNILVSIKEDDRSLVSMRQPNEQLLLSQGDNDYYGLIVPNHVKNKEWHLNIIVDEMIPSINTDFNPPVLLHSNISINRVEENHV